MIEAEEELNAAEDSFQSLINSTENENEEVAKIAQQLKDAREEADRFHKKKIGTEHLLIAILKDFECIGYAEIDKYAKKYNISKVCLAGGVALNCPTSSRIEAMPNIDGVFDQPAANDGGISLGAAIFGAISSGDNVRIEMIPYTGLEYDSKSIEEALKTKKYKYSLK